MLTWTTTGNFNRTEKFLKTLQTGAIFQTLDRVAKEGVNALASATPVDSGVTARSWTYEIVRKRGSVTVYWRNTHVVSGKPIAIMLQYGHGTGTGGYVQGRDYINPAIRPIFDRMADEVWRAVTKA